MAANFRTNGPGCCCSVCEIYSDDFQTDVTGTEWDELAGSWTVSTGILSISDSSAMLIADAVHPDGSNQPAVVKVKARWDTADDRARVILNYSDSDNYLYGEFWIGSDGCGHAQAYEVIAGTETTIGPEYSAPFQMDLDAWHKLQLCYMPGESFEDPGSLTLRIQSAEGYLWLATVATSPDLPGDRAGLATGTVAGTIDFDNFEYLYHYDAETHPQCPECTAGTKCVMHEDDFNRANSTDVGCAWEEVAGNWEIAGSELKIYTADALLLNRTQLRDSDGDLDGHVRFKFTYRCEAGAVLRAILDYTDSSNYFWVKLEPGTHGDAGRVTFWRKTAGVDTQVGHDSVLKELVADAAEPRGVMICWRPDGVVRVWTLIDNGLGNIGTVADSFSTPGVDAVAAEPYVGLGTEASGSAQVWFDDFQLIRLVDTVDELNSVQIGLCGTCELQSCQLTVPDYHDPDYQLWIQEAGSWSDPANFYTTSTADSDAIFYLETGHPQTTDEGFLDLTSAAYTEFYCEGYGSVIRAVLGYQDANNYLFAEVELSADDETTGYLRVGKVDGGARTVFTEEETGVQGGQPNHVGKTEPMLLRMCYDGYELRAIFTNTQPTPAPNQVTFASGTAGTGWNPGKAAVATGTITDTVYFGIFKFYHDIFGGNVEAECLPCAANDRCFFCGENIGAGGDCEDRTPTVFLVELSGIHLLGAGNPNQCPEEAQFNDTFALPYDSEDPGNDRCIWHVTLDFCESLDGVQSEITLYIERVITGGVTYNGIRTLVTLDAHLPSKNEATIEDGQATWERLFLPGTIPAGDVFNIECTPGDPAAPSANGINCLSFFSDWRTIAETNWPGATLPDAQSSFGGVGWLSGSAFVVGCKARIKVLV